MTVEEKSKVVEKKNKVLVGIRIDNNSRDLLNWAIVKVANPGDCVLAIYVCQNSGQAAKEKPRLDLFLEDYEDMCDNNKVILVGQIFAGDSPQKVLVREAKSQSALALVVGTSKPSVFWYKEKCRVSFRGWSSTTRYCVKQLPLTTDVLTLYNGKIVYGRSTKNQPPGFIEDPKLIINQVEESNQSEYGDSEVETVKTEGDLESEGKELVCGSKNFHMRVDSLMQLDSGEKRLGWPLLLRTDSLISQTPNARDMSVVQWALSLPNRSPQRSPQNTTIREENIGFQDEKPEISCLSTLSEPPEDLESFLKIISSVCTWFSPHLLNASTSQFASENLIGKGGCNRVYKGILQNGKQVAVKVMNPSTEAWKSFAREVNIISALDHKHVTPLLGVSIEDNALISVYDYFPKGSLEENLHGNNIEKCALSWEVRFSIAIGIAEALNYLHNECSKPVIHRDVKSSNILLSDRFEPQLSDFGLAIWGPTTSSFQIEDDILGTFGYIAPEYFMYGKVSDKIDVYAFGVVLLELLSGKKPICSDTHKKQESLVMWAKPMIESGDIISLVDPNLNGNFDDAQMKRMIFGAKLCITRAARLRPSISEILRLLKGEKGVENWMILGDGSEEVENRDDEVYPNSRADLHLSMALHDVDYDTTSSDGIEQRTSFSLEDYFKTRWSRSSSFD